MLHSLDRVVLAVNDLDAAVARYARLLGRTPSWRGEQPVAGTQNSLFRLANTVLEIVSPAPPADPASSAAQVGTSLGNWLSEYGEGLRGLAFGCHEVDSFRGALADSGIAASPVEKKIDRDVESGAFLESRCVMLPSEITRGVAISAVESTSPDGVVSPSAPLGPEAAAAFALDHVVVQTREPDATKSLYGQALGLRLALERDFPQWGSRLLFFRVGGVTIEVAASLAGESKENASKGIASDAPADRDRLWGLCWRVGDAAAARDRMQAAEFDVSEVRDGRKPGTRVFTVRDGTCGVPTLVLEPAES
jgi:catechol 2,3-dioxygenase-like lactoylglutathione lyase family enzyme